MAADSSRRISWLPIAWTLACVAVLGTAFFSISWPYVDVHNNLREANAWGWRQYIRYAFSGGVEYRPLLTLSLKGAYELVGLQLWVYQTLVLAQFGATLALLIWLFRPIGTRRGLAAALALSCVVGLHTSRALFLFVPLNAYSSALVFLLLALALALDVRTRAVDWLFLPLTLVALFTLESSLLIIPLLVVLWWQEAPGVSARGVSAAFTALGVYLVARLTFGTPASLGSIYTGSGLGFSPATPEMLRDIFEHAPWLFWVYNVSASLLTVIASEPRAGAYEFVASLLRGETPLWQWLHVGTSLVTTVLIVGSFWLYPPPSERDRLLRTAGLVLIVAGSGLGFLYTRDRIALSAGVGYAVLLFVALTTALEHLPSSRGKRAALLAVVCFMGIAWNVRVAEAYVQLRDAAWDYHLEWTDRYADLGGTAQPQTELLTALRSAAIRRLPDDPRRDPAWTFELFERQFSREDEGRAAADDAADNAVAPVSSPFDIRWKPGVDESARLELEAELGLTAAQRVVRDPRGRTWEYRLRTPTRDRVRAILVHTAVEDTARIDAQRFEIVQ